MQFEKKGKCKNKYIRIDKKGQIHININVWTGICNYKHIYKYLSCTGMVQCSLVWCSLVHYSLVQCGALKCGLVQFSAVWCIVTQCGGADSQCR